MNKIAILVPCYNEALTIENVIKDFQQNCPEADIYVYDNNSSDDTAKIAKACGAIVVHEYKQGKGNVIRSMFRDIEADYYVMVDGDDTYPAEDALKVLEQVKNGRADMAIGDRLSSTYFTENKRAFHNAGNKLVRALINVVFKSNVKDIMTGCRAFNRRFTKSFPILSSGFEIETEMTIHALDKNLSITEVPIAYRDRMEGSESKLNTFSDGFKVIKTIVKLFKDYRPLLFFSLLALVFFVVGGGAFVLVFIEFLKTGLVEHFPTLIVSVGFVIISLLLTAVGLMLDTVKKYQRQNFELFLNVLEEKHKY